MKHFLIALFAVALLSGAPLLAQYEEDPATNELQTETEMETETATGAEIETETDIDGETEVDVDASLDSDLDTDVDDDRYDSELPATGSELPLAALLGLASLAGAAVLRFRS